MRLDKMLYDEKVFCPNVSLLSDYMYHKSRAEKRVTIQEVRHFAFLKSQLVTCPIIFFYEQNFLSFKIES